MTDSLEEALWKSISDCEGCVCLVEIDGQKYCIQREKIKLEDLTECQGEEDDE